jgi:hypothetical protein
LQHSDRVLSIARPDSWLQRPWGRVLLGLMLSQGLYHGFRQLTIGIMMLRDSDGSCDPLVGLILFQCVQAIGLMVGAVLAGAGQRSGPALGAIVGFTNAVFTLITSPPTMALTAPLLIGLPLGQLLVGGLSGWLGCYIWRPFPALTIPGMNRQPVNDGPPKPMKLFEGRIAWFRVFAGSALGVAGWVLAVRIFNALIEAADGRLGTDSLQQDLLVTWELRAFAVLLGGALGGINTANGFKQGLCVAFCTTTILLIWNSSHFTLVIALLTLVSTSTLCVAGGWFGGQLLPPVARMRGHRHLGPT